MSTNLFERPIILLVQWNGISLQFTFSGWGYMLRIYLLLPFTNCLIWIPPKILHVFCPSGKLRTEFTSLTLQNPLGVRPGLADTIFFACRMEHPVWFTNIHTSWLHESIIFLFFVLENKAEQSKYWTLNKKRGS